MTTSLADSGISDPLVKLRPLIDKTWFELINLSYFVVYYFYVAIWNICV